MSELEYCLNAEDLLSSVNEEWVSFAQANEGGTLLPPRIVGRPLWDFIADIETQHIYRILHRRVRTLRIPVRLSFRCDAPERRRLLQLDILPHLGQDLIYRVRTLKEEARAPVPLLDTRQSREESFLTMCGWCKRVAVSPQRWLEVEEAVAALALFDQPRPPQLTHGVCEQCAETLSDTISGRQESAALGKL